VRRFGLLHEDVWNLAEASYVGNDLTAQARLDLALAEVRWLLAAAADEPRAGAVEDGLASVRRLAAARDHAPRFMARLRDDISGELAPRWEALQIALAPLERRAGTEPPEAWADPLVNVSALALWLTVHRETVAALQERLWDADQLIETAGQVLPGPDGVWPPDAPVPARPRLDRRWPMGSFGPVGR